MSQRVGMMRKNVGMRMMESEGLKMMADESVITTGTERMSIGEAAKMMLAMRKEVVVRMQLNDAGRTRLDGDKMKIDNERKMRINVAARLWLGCARRMRNDDVARMRTGMRGKTEIGEEKGDHGKAIAGRKRIGGGEMRMAGDDRRSKRDAGMSRDAIATPLLDEEAIPLNAKAAHPVVGCAVPAGRSVASCCVASCCTAAAIAVGANQAADGTLAAEKPEGNAIQASIATGNEVLHSAQGRRDLQQNKSHLHCQMNRT